jgi:hypothetical protein
MKANYLLEYVRKDCIQVFWFGLAFLGVGCLPFLLSDETAYKAVGGAGIAIGLFALLWGRHALRPLEEPSVLRLGRYGRISEVLESIQREHDCDTAVRVGKVCLTDTWLTVRGVGIQVYRVDEIAGASLQETVQKVNGMSAGSTWHVILTLRDGSSVTVHTPNRLGALMLQSALLLRVS